MADESDDRCPLPVALSPRRDGDVSAAASVGDNDPDPQSLSGSSSVRSLAEMFEQRRCSNHREGKPPIAQRTLRYEDKSTVETKRENKNDKVVRKHESETTTTQSSTVTAEEGKIETESCHKQDTESCVTNETENWVKKKKISRRRKVIKKSREDLVGIVDSGEDCADSVDTPAPGMSGGDQSSCDELATSDGNYVDLTEAAEKHGKVSREKSNGDISHTTTTAETVKVEMKAKPRHSEGDVPCYSAEESGPVRERSLSAGETDPQPPGKRKSSFETRENRKVEVFISPQSKDLSDSPRNSMRNSGKKSGSHRPHFPPPPPPQYQSFVDRPLPTPPPSDHQSPHYDCYSLPSGPPGVSAGSDRPPTPPPIDTIPNRKLFHGSPVSNHTTPPVVPPHLPPALPPRPPELLHPGGFVIIPTPPPLVKIVSSDLITRKWEIFRRKNRKLDVFVDKLSRRIKHSSSQPDLLTIDNEEEEGGGGNHSNNIHIHKRLSLSPLVGNQMKPDQVANGDGADDDDDDPPPPPVRNTSLSHRTRLSVLPFRELPKPPILNKPPTLNRPMTHAVSTATVKYDKVHDSSSSDDDYEDESDYIYAEAPDFWRKPMETAQLNFTAALSKYAPNDDSNEADSVATATTTTTTTTTCDYELSDDEDSVYNTTALLRKKTSKFVSDEPLYQMYTGGVSVDSPPPIHPSRGGESVTPPIVSPPSVVSGPVGAIAGGQLQRTLWCHLPEVKESGVLNTLTDTEKKIQEAIFEIVTSEASYLRSLDVLVDHFMKSQEFTRSDAILPTVCCKRLFSCVEGVRDISEKFIAVLEERQSQNIMMTDVCDIVEEFADKHFNVYVEYCTYQVYQAKMLTTLIQTNVDFMSAKRRLESSHVCQGLTLHSFLMLPMQRITRLPLLVRAIAHRLDPDSEIYQSTASALNAIEKVVRACNDGARKMERLEQSCQIQKQLRFKTTPISVVMETRYLVKEGVLLQVSASKVPFTKSRRKLKRHLYFYLFADLLLVTKKHKDYFEVIDHCQRRFLSVDAPPNFPDGPPTGCKNIFLLVLLQNHENKNIELILAAKSLSEKTRWMESIRPRPSSVEGESVYDTWDCPQVEVIHQYIAQQSDELSLEESEILNVIRKIDDGWWEGERISDGKKGWFPVNHTKEIASQHVRAKNLRLRYQLLAASSEQLRKANSVAKKKK